MIKHFVTLMISCVLFAVLIGSIAAKSSPTTKINHSEQGQDKPWVQTNGPTGAPMDSIVAHPTNENVLYASGQGGGIYKSTNAGASWTRKEIPEATISERLQDLVMDPAHPDTLYTISIHGIHKTTNGGDSWQLVNNGIHYCHLNIHHIVIDPLNTNTLYIGTQTHCPGTMGGALYKTINGGDSWTIISNNLNMPLTGGITTLSIVGTHIYAGIYDFSATQSGTLHYSDDGGSIWENVDFGQPANSYIYSVFINSSNTNEIWVGTNSIYNIPLDEPLFVTFDGGNTWSPVPDFPGHEEVLILGKSPQDAIHVGHHFSKDNGVSWTTWEDFNPPFSGDIVGTPNALAFHPNNSKTIYAALGFGSGIAKTIDEGRNWYRINEGILNTSISILATHSTSPGTLYAAGTGGEGTYKSDDYGASWNWLTGNGISHPWTDEVVINPHDPNSVWEIADVGDIFQTSDGGVNWEKTISPQGFGFRYGSVYALATAPSNPDVIYALKNGFGIYKSSNRGFNWEFLHLSEIDYTYSLAVHPTNPDILYSGYSPKPFQDWAMVRQTEDGGISWRTALHLPESNGVTSVAIDPNDPNTVYAGNTGENGEIWITHDGGDNWENINESFDFTNIHALTVDPSNADVAYAAVWGGGTFKTTDAGNSWQRLPNDPTISAVAVQIDPTDSNIIYLADRTAPKIYRTSNGGLSWETYFDAGNSYYRILSLALAPGNPDVLYTSIFGLTGPMSGDVFRLENGISTNVTGTLPRLPVTLTVDPTNANIVYAVQHAKDVYKTINGGQTWSKISDTGNGLPQSPHVGFNNIVIDPDTPNTLYLLGGSDVDLDLSHTGADPDVMYTVYKSTNAGNTWTNLNDGNLGTNSGSIKGLTIAPSNANVLYAGASNGVFRSTDGGTSWSNINASLNYTHTAGVMLSKDGAHLYAPMLGGGVYAGTVNESTHQVTWDDDSHLSATIYHVQIVVDPTNSHTLYASAYPGGIFKSVDRGTTWTEANFGMASFKIDDPNRQGYYALAISTSDPDVIYLGLYGIGVYKSTDGAGTWRPMNGFAQTMRSQTIMSLLVDPSDPDVVYVSTENGIFSTTDGGQNWNNFSTGLGSTDIRVLARGSDGILYAGSRGNELYQYDVPDSSWLQMSPFGQFGTFWPIWDNRPLYQYTSLLFHPIDPNTIFIGTFPSGIYKSTDGGRSWREKNVGWKNDGVFSLVFHPENPDVLYAGTYNGINRSTDAGDHWEIWDTGWPEEQWVYSIDFDPRDPNIMYACSKNGEDEGRGREDFHGIVMKSLNSGQSWFPIMSGLDDQEFYKIIVDKNEPDILYLATQHGGVFISYDSGNNWESWNDGLFNLVAGTNGNNVTNIMAVSAHGRYIFFGTAGSGVFRRELATFNGSLNYLPLVLKDGH